jgi:hypothetical protein
VKALLLLWLASPAAADWSVYVPQDIPASFEVPEGWTVIEEEEAFRSAARVLAPREEGATLRPALSLRYFEAGQPDFVPPKKMLADLQRKDAATRRQAGSPRAAGSSAGFARIVEVRELRRVPFDASPSKQELLHHYAAVVTTGESYFLVVLTSLDRDYMGYRDLFNRFVRDLKLRR